MFDTRIRNMGSIDSTTQVCDVLIIGAGLSGIYSLQHLRSQFPSWTIRLLEAGSGPGGVWFWNRYPGARLDSESVSYGFSFDEDLLKDWHWKDSYSTQPELLKYIERVYEKHGLAKDIQFDTRIQSAMWDDDHHMWNFVDEDNRQYQSRFFVSCMGFLSAPTLPKIAGVESFQGQAFHTSRWPQHVDPTKDFVGKRIGVIGTGATGIQTITEISKLPDIKSLTVFQRTANWSVPMRNTEITLEEMKELSSRYDSVFQRCDETPMGFLHMADPRKSLEATPEERLQLWETLYAQPGFGKWLGTFSDTYTNHEANKLYSDFIADKIRARVNNPAIAEKLIPKSHGFGTRRVPLESGYFEAYNLPHVDLVDLKETPIKEITEKRVVLSDGTGKELDILIYATGFDAITGAYAAIDFRGKDDRPLMGDSSSEKGKRAVWLDQSPCTYLGLTIPSFPNMFMVLGPHQPFGNATRNIEPAVKFIASALQNCHQHGHTSIEANQDAADAWTEHVIECAQGALSNEVDSWMTGINTNVAGKQVRRVARYAGNAKAYRKKCADVRQNGWQGFTFK